MKKLIHDYIQIARILCVAVCLFGLGKVQAKVTFLEESTVTQEGLYFWYPNGAKAFHWSDEICPRQDCFAVVNGYIFFGWYKGGMTDRQLMISRKKVGEPDWVTVGLPYTNTLVPGKTWGDSHRTVAVGVCKIDGTVHIFYDHHNDPLKYVVSKKNKAFAPDSEFTANAFESTRGYLAVGEPVTITYPKLTQNDDGKLILNYRKGSAVGGNEMVHVYDGNVWTRSTQVTRGGGIPYVEEEDKNYAYGKPYYNNGNVYYAFSVRWKAKQDLGIYNEGVYLAKCGPDMTSRWEDPNGVRHDLPIQDYSPFLIDLPASKDGEGSTSGPDLVVSEDGGVHVTYYGGGSGFKYTYSRKAGDSSFTKHTGAMMTGRAWNNRFYTIETAGSSIKITSGTPGTVNYVTELVHPTNRSFARSESYLADGKLYLIAAESKQSDKRDIYCYVFQLPGAPGGPDEPTEGLVAHWPLNEVDGTVNAAGTQYTATLENGAGWGSDNERASYVTLDGSNQRISTTFTYALSDTDDFTWAWWANQQSTGTTDDGAIMVGNRYPQPGAGGDTYEFIKFTPAGAQFATTSSIGAIEKLNYTKVTPGEWHHYAMVKSGSSFQWYVDGLPQGPPASFNYSEASRIPFLIGGDGDNKPGEHFHGYIDDVVLYRNALTPLEVVSVKNGVYLPHTPPTISAIEDQTILANSATGPLAFAVGDDLTPPGSITLAASSSNTALVPEANIVFSGSGANRMVTVTPRADESGSTDISLHANDGSLITSSTFTLTVLPPGTVSRTMVYNSAGTDSWTCPPGVRQIQVECWGGGGAGGSADSVGTSNVGGGGGGGGAYARKLEVPVTSGVSYSITIPAAATAPAGAADGARFHGGAVSFVGDGGVSVTAAGGQGGECRVASSDTSGTGGSGGNTGSVGDANFAGGNGAQGGVRDGGGGGGGAGASNSGGNGSGTSAGSGGTVGEGAGGSGRSGDNNGGTGQNPGGGGGGAKSQSGKGGEPRSGGSGGLGQIVLTYVQVPVEPPNTALEDWREEHFDTTNGSGSAADTYDVNSDGESNLLEFATGQDPHAGTLVRTEVAMNGGDLEFRYTCSKAALADGMIFQVEWCDSLLDGTWSGAGVTYEPDSSLPVDSELEHWIASVPVSTEGRRFVRLKVSKP